MRYYKTRQAEMLWYVANFLKNNKEKLIARVPVMREVLEEFLEKQDALNKGINLQLNEVSIKTLTKRSTRDAFEEVIMKLTSAQMAAAFRNKPKKEEKYCTRSALRKMTAANLCKEYKKVHDAIKKIRNPEIYGISREFLHDANAYYKEFSAIKSAPAQKRKERAAKNKKLDEAVKECIYMLERSIDPLMRIATEDERELATNYKASRMVIPKGQGRPSDVEVAYRKSRQRKKEGGSMKGEG